MKARLIAPVVFGFVVACLAPAAYGQRAQPPRGQIKAVRVVGQVSVAHGADKAPVALQNNDALAQGDIVTTAKNASVVLVFSNGSTVSLGQEAKMAIDEFLQDPFGAEIKVGELKEEPSTSRTKLNLTYGELVGSVKKLKGASSFLVQTPVGAAGIRGTVFRLVYRPAEAGKAIFTLSTTEGEVIFQGLTGAPVSVREGQEILVDVKIDPATGAVLSVEVKSQAVSPADRQIIEQQVALALESSQPITFAAPPPQQDQTQQNQTQQQNQPPPPENQTPPESAPPPTPPPPQENPPPPENQTPPVSPPAPTPPTAPENQTPPESPPAPTPPTPPENQTPPESAPPPVLPPPPAPEPPRTTPGDGQAG